MQDLILCSPHKQGVIEPCHRALTAVLLFVVLDGTLEILEFGVSEAV